MDFVGEAAGMLWDTWVEMWEAFWGVAPKAFSFFLWVLSALIILPCVYVAGNLYPKWEDWGKGF